jgi:hypothetical protein
MLHHIHCSHCGTIYPWPRGASAACPKCEGTPAREPRRRHTLHNLLSHKPLSPRPLTTYQERQLIVDAMIAMRPHWPNSCSLCGWPVGYFHKGRTKAHYFDGYGKLCRVCARAREHTDEALHAIDRLRTLDALEEDGL